MCVCVCVGVYLGGEIELELSQLSYVIMMEEEMGGKEKVLGECVASMYI